MGRVFYQYLLVGLTIRAGRDRRRSNPDRLVEADPLGDLGLEVRGDKSQACLTVPLVDSHAPFWLLSPVAAIPSRMEAVVRIPLLVARGVPGAEIRALFGICHWNFR
jgi:hypothetical protein